MSPSRRISAYVCRFLTLATPVAWVVFLLSACTTVGTVERPDEGTKISPTSSGHEARSVAQTSDTLATAPYFFDDLEYGSQASFGPASVFLNRGFDVMQFSGISRDLGAFPFRRATRDVLRSIARPDQQIEKVGWGRFLTTEMFPLTFSPKDARWFPNYALHLVGGGITYTNLKEWFTARGVSSPGAWSTFVVLSSGFMNEVAENRGKYGLVADHVSDLYVFDIAGVLVFRSDRVNRFFSEKMHAADWSYVPSLTSMGHLQNAAQFTVFRPSLPGTDRVRLFIRLGLGGMFGLSVKTSATDAISFGAGTATDEMQVTDAQKGELGIKSRSAFGLFYDRNNSLLASVVVSPSVKEPVVINVYPGVLPYIGREAGIWVVLDENLRPTVGVSLRHSLGLGFGIGR